MPETDQPGAGKPASLQEDGNAAQQQAGAGLRQRISKGFRVMLGSAAAWASLLVLVIVVAASGAIDLVLPSTGGSVYIDSPQIYTRERLVNDRFREQAWLAGKLEQLNADQNVISSVVTDQILLSAIAGAVKDAETGKLTGEQLKSRLDEITKARGGEAAALFDDKFEMQARFREIVRRAMIENELDDRHDLGSNSLFLFKFGAAIAPLERTRSRLRIEMKMKPHPLPAMTGLIGEPGHPCDGLYEFECGWVSRDLLADEERLYVHPGGAKEKGVRRFRSPVSYEADLDRWEQFYAKWLQAENRKSVQISRGNSAALESSAHYGDLVLRQTGPLKDLGRRLERYCIAMSEQFPQLSKQNGRCKRPNLWEDAKTDSKKGGEEKASLAIFLERNLSEYFAGMLADSADIDSRGLQELAEKGFSDAYQRKRILQWPQVLLNQVFRNILSLHLNCTVSGEVELLAVQDKFGHQKMGAVNTGHLVQVDFDAFYSNVVQKCLIGKVFPVALDETSEQKINILPDVPDNLSSVPRDSRWPDFLWLNVYRLSSEYRINSININMFRKRGLGGVSEVKQAVELNEVRIDGSGEFRLFAKRDTAGPLDPGRALLAVIQRHADRGKARGTNLGQADESGGLVVGQAVGNVPTGLFLFIQRMSNAQQSHSYSVTPRAEFDLSAEAEASGLTAGSGAEGGIMGVLSRMRSRTEVKRRNRIVGYASESMSAVAADCDSCDSSATFGWVILPETNRGWLFDRSRIVATNEDLSALVSLPAWWERVSIEVTADWMDDSVFNRLGIDKQGPFQVELPLRLDLINKLLTDEENQAPEVDKASFWTMAVRACSKADIVIPGQNLWRSTVVTLGGQKAKLIEVLPDMSGIIARFDQIEVPLPKPGADSSNQPLDLTVWTSEGHYTLTDHVTVEVPTVPVTGRDQPIAACLPPVQAETKPSSDLANKSQ